MSDQIVASKIVVKRDGRFLMRWKCEYELNGVKVSGWGATPQGAIRDALNFKIAEKVIRDFKASRDVAYRFGGNG